MNSGFSLNQQWIVALGAVLAGSLLLAFGRGSIPQAGQATTYSITVVPMDATNLACASDLTMAGRRCAFDGRSQSVTIERPLRPFVTLGRELILLSGVFESSSVAAWLDAARKSGDDTRVTLDCYAKILGTMPEVLVRWASDGPFQPEQSVVVADIEDCVVKR